MDVGVGYVIVALLIVVATLVRFCYPWLTFDIRSLGAYLALAIRLRRWSDSGTFVEVFLKSAKKNPDKPCLVFEGLLHTYQELDVRSNQFANYADGKGLRFGDTVALFMYNEPFFVCAWLGLAKLGVTCAFLNYNLRGKSLIHCLAAVDARVIVVGEGDDLLHAIEEISNHLEDNGIQVWRHGRRTDKQCKFTDVTSDVGVASTDPVSREKRKMSKPKDDALYIFTSGTTGLPKPARISHLRVIGSGLIAQYIYRLTENDVLYITMPLYHSAAFQVGLCGGLCLGATTVLAPKFSATRFWRAVREHNVTVIYYVGEMCRYLLAQPKVEGETDNKVRMAIGSGLRPEIWADFVKRFKIPHLGEFYGSTDGTLLCVNPDGKVGACGRFSPLLKKLIGFQLVKYDFDKAEPVRGSDGRCIPVKIGQPGLLLGVINKRVEFSGYKGREELTEKKRVRNVFKVGDVYFNTGDIFILDEDYYVYFIDRLGDTFRWKGENVATTEVSQAVFAFKGIQEANVYGVSVPGQEGRAGMVAVVMEDEDNFDFKKFYTHLTTSLPSYACPKFVRIKHEMATTGTYKYTKTHLVKDGFDPRVVDDPLYFMDVGLKTFVPLNTAVYDDILAGNAKI